MARGRKARHKKPRLPELDDVFAGRVELRTEELFALIHRVNPTGREMSDSARAQRYAEKTRLQSLLIRQFGDQHLVVKTTEDDDIVSLSQRSGIADACHAVLSELDPDARAWARKQLDLAAAPTVRGSGEEAPAPRPWAPPPDAGEDHAPAGVDELVAAAERALSEYDYETAEADLMRAFELSRGGVEAARPLLGLWVETLGIDARALALEPRLAPAAAEDPQVRTLLALALARCGEPQRALQLVKGIALPGTLEVYAALAAHAVGAGDHAAASRYLEQVGAGDPAHPQIPGLTREIARLRAADRRPAEEALERRYRAEGCRAAEAEARELSERWPESEVARRILREAAGRRREEAIAEQLSAAEEAFAQQRFGDGAQHLQAALAAGCDQPQLEERIAEAQEQERQRQQEAEARAVSERLRADDTPSDGPSSDNGPKAGPSQRLRATAASEKPHSALLGYLSLSAAARTRVRERDERPELGWLEELAAPRSGSRAQAAVAAVRALAATQDRIRAGDDQGALAALEPHEGILRELGDGRRALRSVRLRLAEARRQRACKDLAAAEAALAGGEHLEAQGLLEKVDRGGLDDDGRRRAQVLDERIRDVEAECHLESELDGEVPADKLLPLRDRARELAANARDQAVRDRWRARCVEIDHRVGEALALERLDEPLPLADLYECGPCLTDKDVQSWLDEDGRRLVLVGGWYQWLFLYLIDLPGATVLSRVSMRCPAPLHGDVVGWWRDGERLVIVGEAGDVFELRWGDGEMIRWYSLANLDGRVWPSPLREAAVLPATPYLWFCVGKHDGIRVFDRHRGEICRRLQGTRLIPIAGAEQVVVTTRDDSFELFSDHGIHAREVRLGPGRYLVSASESPSGSGLWVLVTQRDEFEALDLWAIEPGPDRTLETRELLEITDLALFGRHLIATSVELGVGFLIVDGKCDTGTGRLLALAPAEDGVRELYQVPVPFGTLLVRDAEARQVWLVAMAEECLGVVPLGLEPPRVESLGNPSISYEERTMPQLSVGSQYCYHPSGEFGDQVLHILDDYPCDGIREMIPALERMYRGDTADTVALCYALRSSLYPPGLCKPVLEKLVARDPDHPAVRLLQAELAAERGAWDDVHGHLSAVDPREFDDGRAGHFHHLLGLCELHRGRPQAAFDAFDRVGDYDDARCRVSGLIELARALADPSEQPSPDAPLVARVVAVCRAADRALDEGDVKTARALLDAPLIWRAEEISGATRLAEVYLRTTVRTPADRFRKRQALAFFLHLYSFRTRLAIEIDVPGLKWDLDRIHDTAKRARAWLEGPGRHPHHRAGR